MYGEPGHCGEVVFRLAHSCGLTTPNKMRVAMPSDRDMYKMIDIGAELGLTPSSHLTSTTTTHTTATPRPHHQHDTKQLTLQPLGSSRLPLLLQTFLLARRVHLAGWTGCIRNSRSRRDGQCRSCRRGTWHAPAWTRDALSHVRTRPGSMDVSPAVWPVPKALLGTSWVHPPTLRFATRT